jgi:tetratricopeptide (TPR) repeat protein
VEGQGAISGTPPADNFTKPKPTDAQLAAAKAFYQRGAELYARGRYGAAWTEFSSAYQIVALPDLVLNLALTEDKMNRPADAAKHYREFLQKSPNDPDAEKLRRRIAELEQPASVASPQSAASDTARRRFPVYSAIAGGGTVLFTIIGAAAVGSAQAQFNVFAHTCAPNCSMTDVLALQPTLQAGDAFLTLAAIGAAGTVGLLVWELRRGRSPSKTAILTNPPPLNTHGMWAR